MKIKDDLICICEHLRRSHNVRKFPLEKYGDVLDLCWECRYANFFMEKRINFAHKFKPDSLSILEQAYEEKKYKYFM